jgi:hypothetical protein
MSKKRHFHSLSFDKCRIIFEINFIEPDCSIWQKKNKELFFFPHTIDKNIFSYSLIFIR